MSLQELLHYGSYQQSNHVYHPTLARRLGDIAEDRRLLKDHIGSLPIEVFTEIAKMAVQDSHTTPMAISQVSKQWRNVTHNIPFLWGVLVLTERRPKEKAQFWMEKSKGRLRELCVRPSVMNARETKSWTRLLEEVDWAQLKVFRVERWHAVKFLRRIGKLEALKNLETLEIDRANPLNLFPFSIHNSKCSTLRHLTIQSMPQSRLPNTRLQVRNLTSLALCNIKLSECIFSVLQLNLLLEHLSLDRVIYGGFSSHEVELCHLRSLRLSRHFPWKVFSLKMPVLEILKIENQSSGTPFFYPALYRYTMAAITTPLEHTRLTKVILRGCETVSLDIDSEVPQALTSLLRVSPNLQELEISRTTTVKIEIVIEFLASTYRPPPGSTSYHHNFIHNSSISFSRDLICPNLTHVNFSGCPNFQTGSVVRLVKSRLAPQVTASSSFLQGNNEQTTTPLPSLSKGILSLTLDSCPQIDPAWLCWLKNHVSYVSCEL